MNVENNCYWYNSSYLSGSVRLHKKVQLHPAFQYLRSIFLQIPTQFSNYTCDVYYTQCDKILAYEFSFRILSKYSFKKKNWVELCSEKLKYLEVFGGKLET